MPAGTYLVTFRPFRHDWRLKNAFPALDLPISQSLPRAIGPMDAISLKISSCLSMPIYNKLYMILDMNASEKSAGAPPLPRLPRLLACARRVPDFRVNRRRRHVLAEVIFIAVAAGAANFTSFYEMADFGRARVAWLRENGLELPGGIPSHDTFRRLLSLLDPAALRRCAEAFREEFRHSLAGDGVAVDGKCQRRACPAGGRAPCVVSAWAVSARAAVGEAMVPGKTNETAAMPALIRRLPIRGAVVTADAAGCQREVARAVVEARADYVLALKGNQGTMEEEMGALLADVAAREPEGHAGSLDKGHGRIERRRLWMATDLGWYADRRKWCKLRSAAMVECERTAGGATTAERRLFISSLLVPPDRMLAYVRGHWGVENSLHWVLDMTFGEDLSRARWRNAPENLAVLRRIAVGRLMACGDPKMSVRRKAKLAAVSTELLSEVVM